MRLTLRKLGEFTLDDVARISLRMEAAEIAKAARVAGEAEQQIVSNLFSSEIPGEVFYLFDRRKLALVLDPAVPPGVVFIVNDRGQILAKQTILPLHARL